MATVLRSLSYRYQWLFDLIVGMSSLAVGGEPRFRQLPLEGLEIYPEMKVLDLCCGSGQGTQYLVERSHHVIGLDADAVPLKRAKQRVPQAEYVQAWAEEMPFADNEFDIVYTSATLHEMQPEQCLQIVQEVHRVLKPGGCFTQIDFHRPKNWVFRLNLYGFLWLFEHQTAWDFVQLNLPNVLTEKGFVVKRFKRYAGGSLQLIQADKIG
ncbi:class I SAM-dependent methyltransferase [Oscillatoria sp. FACHB-1407]|uniref:class I SAM-dependent methyltransferase n=1 Tax=Oscillatoria sp. FACHB-1407 TaxID=2692847 RepID=UPI0016873B37|nr:class I SAM-dependent methyltransferase [Oscillatoria sp. FACHB-1407]MBD2459946.1 class I SAM-dependent methyltransferase [Oscillatoria sp. FACHB-1407]